MYIRAPEMKCGRGPRLLCKRETLKESRRRVRMVKQTHKQKHRLKKLQ